MATAFIYGSMLALAVILGVALSGWARSTRYKRRAPRKRGRAIDLELRGRMRPGGPGSSTKRHA